MTDADPERCPLCGEPNACSAAAAARCGGTCRDCWCFGRTLDAAVLAKVPPAARGVACVCERCATASPAAACDAARTDQTDQKVGRGRA